MAPALPLTAIQDYALTADELKQFQDQGYIGPYNLFEESEIESHLKSCAKFPNILLPWRKARHVAVQEMAGIGRHPIILSKVVSILGNDVLLWGSQIIKQEPFKKHPIHIDIEHTAWEGVTIWLALKNVLGGSSFCVIPGSHLFHLTQKDLEEVNTFKKKDDEAVLKKAQEINAASTLKYLNITNGQFILFSGKLWHGTKNVTPDPRFSMIFQYTRPDNQIKIPKNYSLPNTTWYRYQPPCLLVHGHDNFKTNKVINFMDINVVKTFIKGLFFYLPVNGLRKLDSFFRIRK